jgi:hypothetical protein
LKLKLFSNNISPNDSSVISDFVELTGGGYVPFSLSGTTWSLSNTTASYPQQTWNFTASVGNVYGYYVTTADDSTVIFAEKFDDGPYLVAASGDIIRVTLSITMA